MTISYIPVAGTAKEIASAALSVVKPVTYPVPEKPGMALATLVGPTSLPSSASNLVLIWSDVAAIAILTTSIVIV